VRILQQRLDVVVLRKPGYEHDWQGRVPLPERPAALRATHHGHGHVEDDRTDPRAVLGKQFERFSPVAGDQCFESQALGDPLAGPAKHGLVIDEEYVVTRRIDL
jgi:hypothetical protein